MKQNTEVAKRKVTSQGSQGSLRKEVAEAFPRLTSDQVAALLKQAKLETYTTGETVIREGTYANGFFVVVKGQAEVLQFDDANKYRKIRRLDPGDFFGEIGLLTPPRRTATVRAKTRLDVIALRNDQFFALLHHAPEAAKATSRVGAERASRPRPKAKTPPGSSKPKTTRASTSRRRRAKPKA
ncbi:MAG: cyclic nucleotide-binding domain-containing protein [Candidatus Dormibacteraeota bacterium]|nr:cyclic nucleotide-binding domain-containing protein [Candidatus Dormibacteraeota bacterium]